MSKHIEREAVVPSALGHERLDHVAADLFPEFSRSRLQGWIRSGELTVDGRARKPKDRVAGGAMLALAGSLPELTFAPQAIDLDIIYEDDTVLVVNKPAGLVAHPAAGNPDGTLLNGLLHHAPELAHVPRAGIVHRLDKETTGLLVVARTVEAQVHLVDQLKARTVKRTYDAIVEGRVLQPGVVDAPIDRHPVHRTRMAVRPNGRPAVTHYTPVTTFAEHTHLAVKLETGRTHQIRVHMQHVGWPMVGDPVYGAKKPSVRFPRQALHARALAFEHPATGELITFRAPQPEDLRDLLDTLA